MSAGLPINALVRMGEVDQDYSTVLEQEAKAVVWLVHSTSVLDETGRLLYTMIAESDDGRMRTLGERVTQQETLLKWSCSGSVDGLELVSLRGAGSPLVVGR